MVAVPFIPDVVLGFNIVMLAVGTVELWFMVLVVVVPLNIAKVEIWFIVAAMVIGIVTAVRSPSLLSP